MGTLKGMGPSFAVFTLLLAAVGDKPREDATESLCHGRRYSMGTIANGTSPYIGLNADGVSGQFLLDYGTTSSSLSASAFAAPDQSGRSVALSLPGDPSGYFQVKHYTVPRQPIGSQIGIIGTDILSNLSVQFSGASIFLSAQTCPFNALHANGLVPIAQRDFFSSRKTNPSKLPNVPVVFLQLGAVHTWAQIDTGYDDVVYLHSVDINQALFDRLVGDGIALDHIDDISVSTCAGGERRPVYTVKGRSLIIETDQATPIVQTDTFHLILKPANSCGGIGAISVPAAQLGASFLRIFGTVVFDPRSETVWLNDQTQSR
jgi:hypothetical protein